MAAADCGRMRATTSNNLSMNSGSHAPFSGPERAILVGVELPDATTDIESSLDELGSLADTAGACVVDRLTQRRERVHPALFIGKGKAADIAEKCSELKADLVVFDHDLSPAQVRNLERELGVRVIDRTELILDIFARRARTKQARLQVELAQLQYQLPRLRRMWTHLSRIEGGIGLRGPGETQIEVDRRRARTRIRDLERSLEHIQTRKSLETSGRKEFFTVALVGYTNVGKTALMNALTGEALLAENRLFATLDATTRRLDLPSGQSALLSDTVGFIQNIPHHLVASFHATLEEVREADLILHVVDVSHPERRSQVQSVDGVLLNLKCTDKPTLYVLNKCDLLEEGAKPMHLEQFEFSVLVSARTGVGLEALRNQIESRAEQNRVEMDVVLPASEGKVAAYIAEHGNVLERHYEDARVHLKARLLPRHAHRVRKMMAELTQCE